MTDTGPTNGTKPQPTQPRLFEMVRHRDVTGFSGIGVVADGVQWPDGSVTFRWRGPWPSTCIFDGIDAVVAVHGHGGATEIRWIEPDSPRRTVRERHSRTAPLDSSFDDPSADYPDEHDHLKGFADGDGR